MKLKTVHTYQSVRFNLRDETHFDARKQGMEKIEMEYDERLLIVRITIPGKDSVIVFPTNCSYVVEADAAVAEAPKQKKSVKTE